MMIPATHFPRSTSYHTASLSDGAQALYILDTHQTTSANGSVNDYVDALVKNCGLQDLGRGASIPADWVQLVLPQVSGNTGLFAPAGQNTSASEAACFGGVIAGVVKGHDDFNMGAFLGPFVGILAGSALVLGLLLWCSGHYRTPVVPLPPQVPAVPPAPSAPEPAHTAPEASAP
jgi:hypothetical protein